MIFALALVVLLSAFVILWNLRTQPVNTTPLMLSMQKKTGVKPQQTWVPLDSISPEVIRAVIACEDNNFFYHHGFDIDAIKEAMQRNQEGKKVFGASTITQQTAKNVFLPSQRTWVRKGAELLLAVAIEFIWGKDRIMEVYLNVIEMGENIYGIEAAAQHYFNKKALDLTKYEAVMIAVALPSPRKLNPARPGRYMQMRQVQVFDVINKLMGGGWYKNVKNISQIKVNYLDAYPRAAQEPTAPQDTLSTEVDSALQEGEFDEFDESDEADTSKIDSLKP